MVKQNALQLDRVVFIGRTYFEYIRMFDLGGYDLKRGAVLDCAAGPSSFTAEVRKQGCEAIACDALYGCQVETLKDKGAKDIEHTFQKVDDVPHLYVWKYYRDRREIIALRHKALECFVNDYPSGLKDGRYVRAELPQLPFPDRTFSLCCRATFCFCMATGWILIFMFLRCSK